MSQLQTTRNELLTVSQSEMKLISGSLKLRGYALFLTKYLPLLLML